MDIPDVVVYDRATWKYKDELPEDERAGWPYQGDASDLYVKEVFTDEETFERPTLCVVVERRDAWIGKGEDAFWRPLSATEVEEFRESARVQYEDGAEEVNPLWHPVVQREFHILQAISALQAAGLPANRRWFSA